MRRLLAIGRLRLGVVVRCAAIVAVLFGVAGVACHAKEMCPWINEATAAGFLRGSVTMTVTHTSGGADKAEAAGATATGTSVTVGDAVCEFVRHDASGASKLRIEVVTMANVEASYPGFRARCGADGRPVRAIGNEAVACGMTTTSRGVGEQVVGRVRERAFVVSTVAGTGADQAMLRETTLRAAEQVAGFLF